MKGDYVEVLLDGRTRRVSNLRPRTMRGFEFHRISETNGAWTVMVRLGSGGNSGFLERGKWVPFDDYIEKNWSTGAGDDASPEGTDDD